MNTFNRNGLSNPAWGDLKTVLAMMASCPSCKGHAFVKTRSVASTLVSTGYSQQDLSPMWVKIKEMSGSFPTYSACPALIRSVLYREVPLYSNHEVNGDMSVIFIIILLI